MKDYNSYYVSLQFIYETMYKNGLDLATIEDILRESFDEWMESEELEDELNDKGTD